MKTIEERADEYVGHPKEIDEFSSATIKRQAFIDGARAQRKIDIDKACEWLMTNLEIPEDGVISEEEGKELLGDKPVTFIEEFRKAMEDEIWR